MTITKKVSLKVTATIALHPLPITNLQTPPVLSLSHSSPLTLETLNPVIYGKSAVSSAREKSMVWYSTGWIGSRSGCLNLNWEERESSWMSSMHDSKNRVGTGAGMCKGKLVLWVRRSQRNGEADLKSKREPRDHQCQQISLSASQRCCMMYKIII